MFIFFIGVSQSKRRLLANYVRTSYDHVISVATSSIPFLRYNDANRALMGSNMQRQSLPLVEQERAIVRTEVLKNVAKYGQLNIITEQSCYISYVSSRKIVINEINYFKNNLVNSNFSIRTKLKKNFRFISRLKRKYLSNSRTYFLQKYRKSNDNVLLLQNSVVMKDFWVRKKALLAAGSNIIGGTLALGRNLVIAYMGWEGYNFEDAIVISERLVLEDVWF